MLCSALSCDVCRSGEALVHAVGFVQGIVSFKHHMMIHLCQLPLWLMQNDFFYAGVNLTVTILLYPFLTFCQADTPHPRPSHLHVSGHLQAAFC